MTGFMFFWSEADEKFSSEQSNTAQGLRIWFENKIKVDGSKMTDISLKHFTNGKLDMELPVHSHKIRNIVDELSELIIF